MTSIYWNEMCCAKIRSTLTTNRHTSFSLHKVLSTHGSLKNCRLLPPLFLRPYLSNFKFFIKKKKYASQQNFKMFHLQSIMIFLENFFLFPDKIYRFLAQNLCLSLFQLKQTKAVNQYRINIFWRKILDENIKNLSLRMLRQTVPTIVQNCQNSCTVLMRKIWVQCSMHKYPSMNWHEEVGKRSAVKIPVSTFQHKAFF